MRIRAESHKRGRKEKKDWIGEGMKATGEIDRKRNSKRRAVSL